jgi:hypothetical protein
VSRCLSGTIGFHQLRVNAHRYRDPSHLREGAVPSHPNEDRDITAEGNVNAELFGSSLAGKVLGQALAQLPRVVANNIVLNGAVTRPPVKHPHADLMLGDLALAAFEGLPSNKQKEL